MIPWIELPAKQTPKLVCQLTCKTGLLISTLRNFFTSVSTRVFKLLHFLLEVKPISWSGLKLASRACDYWASPFYHIQGGVDFLQPLCLSMCIYSQRLAHTSLKEKLPAILYSLSSEDSVIISFLTDTAMCLKENSIFHICISCFDETLRELETTAHLFFQRLQTQLLILIQKLKKKKTKTKFVLDKMPDQQQTGISQTNQDIWLCSLPSWGTIPE